MSKQAMICLISKEAMANALPVLEYRPDLVFLAATNEQTRNAGYLKEFFAKKGIQSEIIPGMDAYHPEPNKNVMNTLFDNNPDYTFTLNSTGGTKIMSLAAYEVFSSSGKKVVYCNTPGCEIITLPEGKIDKTLTVELSAEDYLTAYGYTIDQRDLKEPSEEYKPLFRHLLNDGGLKEFISLSNKVKTMKKLLDKGQVITSNGKQYSFAKKGKDYILEWKKGQSLHFASERFCEGTWLEELAYYFMKVNKRECLASMHIYSPDQSRNEIDMLYVKNLTLHLVSAKSGPLNKKDLFELHGLQVLAGGIMARPAILHAAKIKQADAQRAKEMRIDAISVFELNRLL